jgi:translation initiation factor IF-3
MSKEYRINQNIKAEFVNLVKEDGVMLERTPIGQALEMAYSEELDLVEVSPGGKGYPVCKILNFEKLIYKENKVQKQHQNKTETKEIRFSYNIGENDLRIKNKKVVEFLGKKNNVKYVLQLKGREKIMLENSKEKMNECLLEFQDIAKWNKIDISSHNNSISISVILNPA